MIALLISVMLVSQAPRSGTIGLHAVRVQNKILVAGGINRRENVRETWLFDSSKHTWKRGSDWANTRTFGVAAEHGKKVYIFGGIEASGRHSKLIEAYDPGLDKWMAIGVMPEPMSRAAGTVWKGKLYLSGGFNGKSDRESAQNSGRMWEYDFAKSTWRSRKEMRIPRHAHCLIAFRNRLWAIGGYGAGVGASVESYDLATNSWRAERNLPVERGFFGADVIAGKLVAFGQIFKPTHPVEWSPSGWKERSTPDLPIRRFAYLQGTHGFLVFGGEENGAPFQTFKP